MLKILFNIFLTTCFIKLYLKKNSQQQNTCPALQFWLELGATLRVLTGHLALHSRLSFYQIHFSFKLPNHVIMFSSLSIFFEPPVKGKVVHAGLAFSYFCIAKPNCSLCPRVFFGKFSSFGKKFVKKILCQMFLFQKNHEISIIFFFNQCKLI